MRTFRILSRSSSPTDPSDPVLGIFPNTPLDGTLLPLAPQPPIFLTHTHIIPPSNHHVPIPLFRMEPPLTRCTHIPHPYRYTLTPTHTTAPLVPSASPIHTHHLPCIPIPTPQKLKMILQLVLQLKPCYDLYFI